MTSDLSDALWPDERRLALRELADCSGWSEAEITELVEYGALIPAEASAERWVFGIRSITVARTAFRLHKDYELDPHGVAVLLGYIDRIRDLEEQLCALRAKLPR